MIPRLSLQPPPTDLYRLFGAALVDAGFSGEVSFSDGDRTVMSVDNSIYRIVPQAIAYPRSVDDLALLARLAATEGFRAIRIFARGGGTGTNAQSLGEGLVVDVSRHMNRIIEIDVAARRARVQAGVVKDQLNAALRADGLFFAPELSTSNRATIGGMVSTDASGQGSRVYGKTRDHVCSVLIVLADGTPWQTAPLAMPSWRQLSARQDHIGRIHEAAAKACLEGREEILAHFPKLSRSVTGYDLVHAVPAEQVLDLTALVCGSEGTLGIVAEVEVSLLPIPPLQTLALIGYRSFRAALGDAGTLIAARATSVETIDDRILERARGDATWTTISHLFANDGIAAVNIVEFCGDTPDELAAATTRVERALADAPMQDRVGVSFAEGETVAAVWEMRKRAVGLLSADDGRKMAVPFIEDTAVPADMLAAYVDELRALLDHHDLSYGMFGHVDAGVLHVRPLLDLADARQQALIRPITEAVVELTRKYGGVLWGEHGKGVRSEFAPAYFGPLYRRLQAIKQAFDPYDQYNPGKIAAPPGGALRRIDGTSLRAEGRAPPGETDDTFERARKCNGNGACFDFEADAAMCPSWKATRDRRNSPKGRATLAEEWLRRLGERGMEAGRAAASQRRHPGWITWPRRTLNSLLSRPDFSHEVKQSMDLCLGCKACTTGCPLKVDVPAFRARFLELYHGRYIRRLDEVLVAHIENVLHIASTVPALYNAVILSRAGRFVASVLGLAELPRMSLPLTRRAARAGLPLATVTALRQLPADERQRSVVLVADTLVAAFDSSLCMDLAALLSSIGLQPWLAPVRPTGKSLHDAGLLPGFRRVAETTATTLQALSSTGVQLVGVDPAMTLVYRDEYRRIMGERFSPPVLLIEELLKGHLTRVRAAASGSPAGQFRLLMHCSEAARLPTAGRMWSEIFETAGQSCEIIKAGCCGMAGTFGHKRRHRPISEKLYRSSWREKVRAHEASTELLATGFSCRSQVATMDQTHLRHPVSALKDIIAQRAVDKTCLNL